MHTINFSTNSPLHVSSPTSSDRSQLSQSVLGVQNRPVETVSGQPERSQSTISNRQQLLSSVSEQLEKLGRPNEGWFFEREKGSLESLSEKHLLGIQAILEQTRDVTNIMSFGARSGGFELAMQIRHDLDSLFPNEKACHNELARNYLDAVSLQNHGHTELIKIEGMDLYKMQNPFWDIGYKHGIENASNMLFLITNEWLNSPFCRQEFDWLQGSANDSVRSGFVVADKVDSSHPALKEVLDFAQANDSFLMTLMPKENTELQNIKVSGSAPMSYQYSIGSQEFSVIMDWLKDQK